MGETTPKYPEIKVQLTGQDGNGFFIVCRVRDALKQDGIPESERQEFFEEALSGDYDHMLTTVMAWVKVS